MYDVRLDASGFALVVDVLHHLVLPAFTLGIIFLAQYSRISRASMLDVLGADYVRTARAKGLSERVVLYKHALRNAVLPVVTLAGLQFGSMLSGAVAGGDGLQLAGTRAARVRVDPAPRPPDHPRNPVLRPRGWWWWPTCSPTWRTASSTRASAPVDSDRSTRHVPAPTDIDKRTV